jgi:hypothetical protein
MGRTPRISPIAPGGKNASGETFTPGRHHWGDVFPCFFAGGGVRGGQVIGRTDRLGGLPVTEAFTPSDLAATIFSVLGIDPGAEFRDAAGRPYRMWLGKPIKQLMTYANVVRRAALGDERALSAVERTAPLCFSQPGRDR